MSAATAGHLTVVKASSDNISYNEIDGIDNASIGPTINLLDSTAFKDGAYVKRISGLTEGTFEVSGHFIADTGQNQVRSLMRAGSFCYFMVLHNGTLGYGAKCWVKSFKIDSQVGATIKFSASLQFNSPLTSGSPPSITT